MSSDTRAIAGYVRLWHGLQDCDLCGSKQGPGPVAAGLPRHCTSRIAIFASTEPDRETTIVLRPTFRACVLGVGVPTCLLSQVLLSMVATAHWSGAPAAGANLALAAVIGLGAATAAWRRVRCWVDPTGITAYNVFGTWRAGWDQIEVVGVKNLGGGNRLGDPSLIAAAIKDTTEPRGITATLAFAGKPAPTAALAGIRAIAPTSTEVLPDDRDVGAEWYRRRWQDRQPRHPHTGYFD